MLYASSNPQSGNSYILLSQAKLAPTGIVIKGAVLSSLCLAPCAFHQSPLARIIHESVSRDREDGRATGQPQGVESEAYLNGTSQGSTLEDARKDGHIRGRSSRFMNYPG